MIRKKIGAAAIILLCSLLVMSGCSFLNNDGKKEVVDKSSGDTETANLIPGADSKDYQILRPLSNDPLRGYINYGVNNRVDVDQLESGLMEMSKSTFSPDDYVFQSGQYLKESDINGILYRKGQEPTKKDPSGLNPPLGKGKDVVERAKSSPKYLNYVLEQDYLKKRGNGKYELAGVSIALSLNSVYKDRIKDKSGGLHDVLVPLQSSEVKKWGKEHADEVVKRIRTVNGLERVPIFLTLYMTAPPDSLIPGNFFAKTEVSGGSSSINGWDKLDEQYVLFPSDAASGRYKSDLDKFNRFKEDVQKYYPDFVGVIGKGYYQNKEIKDLTININIKFMDETEVISFTNYVTSIVNRRFRFSREVPVHIYITSGDEQEALIERTSNMDEPYVHLFRH
ncbi:CamS family sex pheromone protein [Sporolactobacillus sp. THM7-7]|nr:CamS family sex pheromone protein [Sporolactobacillus sp. THM7-7]